VDRQCTHTPNFSTIEQTAARLASYCDVSNWTPSTISDLTGSGLKQSAAFRTDCVLSHQMNIDDIWRICSQASLEFHHSLRFALKPDQLKGDHGRKLNFALLLPVKFRGGVNEMSE